MATKEYTQKELPSGSFVQWTNLDGTDDGRGIYLADYPLKSLQSSGTGTYTVEGSNDGGTTWSTLHAMDDGAELTAVAVDTINMVMENPGLIRVVAATATDLVVTLVATRHIL